MQKSIWKLSSIKKIVFFIFFSSFFLLHTSHAAFINEKDNCEVYKGYNKYACQSKVHCAKYQPPQVSFHTTRYTKDMKTLLWWSSRQAFLKGKDVYRENQNGIYSCAVIKIQFNTLELMKKRLLKIDKSWSLSESLRKKINLKLKKIRRLANLKKCRNTDKNTIYSKKDILTESTFELCKYNFYLEYMKEYYKDLYHLLEIDRANIKKYKYQIGQVAYEEEKIQNEILNERKHTYKIFHFAYQSYIDYETNLPLHLYLELIKEDFIVFRKKLYKSLSPINQVVYKIHNAMSID